MNIPILLPILFYLLLIFAASIYVARKQGSQSFLSDYFLGNRSLNGFLLAMTLTTTYVSASSFIGGPGSAYKYGLGWVFIAMIQVPAVWLSLGVLGKKFAILARQYQAITLNDMLYARYRSPFIVAFASLSLLLGFLGAMTVQFIGGARLLESAANLPYSLGLGIFVVTVALYTTFGGFRASVVNDAVQGLTMLLGTAVLLTAVIHSAGGMTHAVEKLRQINPQLITPEGVNSIINPACLFSFSILVCFGVIGLPHTAVRCFAYKDSRSLHGGMLIGTLVMFLLMLGMHLSGALGRAILPDLAVPDHVIPTLTISVLPPLFAGIFLAAPMAAIMSTVNAQLLQSSATLINDLFLRAFPHYRKNDYLLRVLTVFVTLVLSGLLWIAALKPPDMIIWLNLLSFGALEAVFLWPLLLGLYWEKANAAGALSAMITGGVSYILFLVVKLPLAHFHPVVPAIFLSLIAFIIGNHFASHKNHPAEFATEKEKQNALDTNQN